MKLLLTSIGICNTALAEELHNLTGKDPAEVRVGFVLTAGNVESGSKTGKYWMIRQVTDMIDHGYQWVDVIDIAAPHVDWRARLAEVDVVVIGGGNTYYLLDQARKTGFLDWIKEMKDVKVFVGSSAGSILLTPTIAVATVEPADDNFLGLTDLTAAGLVDFEVSVHTPNDISHEANRTYLDTIQNELYGIDDNAGLVVIDYDVRIVGTGEGVKYE